MLALELGKFPHEVEQIPMRDFMELLAEKHLRAEPEQPKGKTAKDFKAAMSHLVKKKDG